MFEYDEKLKLRSLSIWGFDVQNLELDKIAHVPMHGWRVATKEEPMLYVENLQCCIGIYAYSENFGFAAHINPVVMRVDDYELDENRRAIRCKRIETLKKVILEKVLPNEKVQIGISIGSDPLDENYPTVKMIHEGINSLIIELNSIGIKTVKLETICAPEFILDTENSKIILPNIYKEEKKIK